MEVEMDKSKKLLQKEMGENKLLIEENEQFDKSNKELISINTTLVRSQKQYEEKWRKLYHALQFYKEFYNKYIELVLNNVSNKTQDLQTLERYKEQHSNFELLLRDPEKLINEKRKKDEEFGKFVNISILDLNDEHMREENRMEHILQTAEKGDFKIYLLNLAKDVNLLWKKNDGNKLREKSVPIVKYKRSISNPIDYRTETRKNWIENSNKNLNTVFKESNEKNILKNNLNVTNPMKSPVFGNNNKGIEKEIEDLGLESPEQIVYHTNYEEEEEEEDNVDDNGGMKD